MRPPARASPPGAYGPRRRSSDQRGDGPTGQALGGEAFGGGQRGDTAALGLVEHTADRVADALDARAVCGPANNPLASHAGADRLAARGILYAPDFVVNAGGVIYLDLEAKKLGSRSEIMQRVEGIGDTIRRVFDEAERRGVTPLAAAEGLAAERLTGRTVPALV